MTKKWFHVALTVKLCIGKPSISKAPKYEAVLCFHVFFCENVFFCKARWYWTLNIKSYTITAGDKYKVWEWRATTRRILCNFFPFSPLSHNGLLDSFTLCLSLPDHTSLFGQKGDDDHIFQMRLFRIKTNDFLPSKLFFPILWICDCQRPLFPPLLSSMSFTRSNFAENYTVNSG